LDICHVSLNNFFDKAQFGENKNGLKTDFTYNTVSFVPIFHR